MNWTVDWVVLIDGRNISSTLKSYLLDISVVDKAGTASDTCTLTLDDSDMTLRLPGDISTITVILEGVQVFSGTVDKVMSRGDRGGGKVLSVNAKGYDTKGKAKETQRFHADDATLKDFLGKAAKAAGFTLKIDDELGAVQRDYWSADGESFLHLGERLARELSATFKLRGKEAVFMPRGKDFGLPTITGTRGVNLISWEIEPLIGRGLYKAAKVRWFDREKAEFAEEEEDFASERAGAEATEVVRSTAANKDQAKALAKSRKTESERRGGEGSAEINIAPGAQAEGLFVLVGTRPGVDGTYRIESVTHTANRSGGATTRLDLKQPQGGAGTDSR